MIDTMTGKQLRALRERLGMTQADMARALGLKCDERADRPSSSEITSSHISRMEAGHIRISGPEEMAILKLWKGQRNPIADPDDFPPKEVRRIRLALGLSLQDFAERLGLKSHAQAAHLESGRTAVNWAKAIVLQELSRKIRKPKRRKAAKA